MIDTTKTSSPDHACSTSAVICTRQHRQHTQAEREREREREAHSGCYRSLHPELKFSVLRRSQVEVITGAVWNSTRAQDSGGTNTQR